MSSVLDDRNVIRVPDPGFADLRLVWPPGPSIGGVLGGSWWPRTRELSRELPALLAAVHDRCGVVVARISMSTTVWDATPEKLDVGDRVVALAWFRAHDAHAIRLLGGDCWHLDLLVIPPDTAPDAAGVALALMAAGHATAALHAIGTCGGSGSPGRCR